MLLRTDLPDKAQRHDTQTGYSLQRAPKLIYTKKHLIALAKMVIIDYFKIIVPLFPLPIHLTDIKMS